MSEVTLSVASPHVLLELFGAGDQHLRRVRDALGVEVAARDRQIFLQGNDEQVAQAARVFGELTDIVDRQGSLRSEDVESVIHAVRGDVASTPADTIELLESARRVRPRTQGQVRYVRAVQQNPLVFCIGPAGTGKTYLSVALAVQAFRQEEVKKIVLVRPAVEAGEKLGFLPGDLQAKVNPYLRPLLDALHDMVAYDQIKRYMDNDLIEIIPLAYMRGRTLNHSYIILDEGQNTTVPQMKMFLTRMGVGSKIVVTGDVTQIDLPAQTRSGLIDAAARLRDVEGVEVVQLTDKDVVRHRLVQDIIRAYDESRPRGKKHAPGRPGRGA